MGVREEKNNKTLGQRQQDAEKVTQRIRAAQGVSLQASVLRIHPHTLGSPEIVKNTAVLAAAHPEVF